MRYPTSRCVWGSSHKPRGSRAQNPWRLWYGDGQRSTYHPVRWTNQLGFWNPPRRTDNWNYWKVLTQWATQPQKLRGFFSFSLNKQATKEKKQKKVARVILPILYITQNKRWTKLDFRWSPFLFGMHLNLPHTIVFVYLVDTENEDSLIVSKEVDKHCVELVSSDVVLFYIVVS